MFTSIRNPHRVLGDSSTSPHFAQTNADVLGHRHLGTTFIYAKVDFNSLKKVHLDWPEEDVQMSAWKIYFVSRWR